MEKLSTFSDQRLLGRCVYCGRTSDTRDHAPSRVLLDAPFPRDLPVVPCCRACNASFSLDEEYVATAIECAICGTTDPGRLKRSRIATTLSSQPRLRARIESARSTGHVGLFVEANRLRNVVLKLARGHAAFELSEPQWTEPSSVWWATLASLEPRLRSSFESPPHAYIFPEVGSRAMQRIVQGLFSSRSTDDRSGWLTVQEGRYRYLATAGDEITVRIVLSEYLACEAAWAPDL
jgi:hypothetical protein